jgi:hypothetical protein
MYLSRLITKCVLHKCWRLTFPDNWDSILDELYFFLIFLSAWNAFWNETTISLCLKSPWQLWSLAKNFVVSQWRIFTGIMSLGFLRSHSYFLSDFYCLLNLAFKPTGQKLGIKCWWWEQHRHLVNNTLSTFGSAFVKGMRNPARKAGNENIHYGQEDIVQIVSSLRPHDKFSL